MSQLEFTTDQLQLIAYKIGLENNAMLRIMLANQAKIMDALNIEPEIPTAAYSDLLPVQKVGNKSSVELHLELAEAISNLLQHRAWQWVQLIPGDDETTDNS